MIREATNEDAKAFAEILFRSPQAGRMLLGQDRAPDPFARRMPYDEAATFVVDGDDGLAATATCATKKVTVGGEQVRVGYVFDVAVAPTARRRGLARRLLDRVEAWSAEHETSLLYAHVMRGNEASTGTFRQAGYRIACDLTGRVYPVFGKPAVPPHDATPVTDWVAAADLLAASLAPYDLVRPLDGPRLHRFWTSLPGWNEEDVWTTGSAVLGLWDYRGVTRSVPLRLAPEVRVLGAVGKVLRGLRVPFPRTPELGKPMSYGLVLGGTGDETVLRALLRASVGRARERGIDVVLFFHDSRAVPAWAKAAFSVTDTYHLMTKEQSPDGPRLGERPVWVDPADL